MNYVLAIAHVLNISMLNYCASISRAIAAHRGDRVSLITYFFAADVHNCSKFCLKIVLTNNGRMPFTGYKTRWRE